MIKVGIFSKGILKTVPYLEVFLQGKVVLNPKSPEGLHAIAGWGHKPTAKKAMEKAKEWNLPYWALEDGFIRSFTSEDPPLSIVIDPVGIYYNAYRPSHLENLLNSDDWKKEELLSKARKLREIIVRYEISKYNNFKPIPRELGESLKGRKVVLVVEQTYGDMSVELGMANEETFQEMYECALQENPQALILIKIHPEVINGKKKGYLTKVKLYSNTKVLYENYNPIGLLKRVDEVYTVTSQIGLEALLLEKQVHCFGAPFYSGWGLTTDRKKIDRRNKRLSLEELIAAVYFLYPKYVIPEGKTYRLAEVFEVVEKLCYNLVT